MKVLHGPVNVGNQPWTLSRYERRLGVRSDLVVSYSTWLKYPADRCLHALDAGKLTKFARRFPFGLKAALKYDVLHYYFGQSYWNWGTSTDRLEWRFGDLILARRLGKKVFMTLQGCDVRLAGRSDERHRTTACRAGRCDAYSACREAYDARRLELIERILPYCHRVFVLNPDLAAHVPGSVFLPYANFDVEAMTPTPPRTDGPIRIVHAPSDASIKGTAGIVAAVERLKERYPIELTLVQGLPHDEAVQIYRSADLVVDQVLLGWYGGFAVETMAMGKPVVCYVRESDLGVLPAPMRSDLPIINATAETLEERLEDCIRRRDQWPEWSRRAREYVLRWHNPRHLAAAVVAAYRDPESRLDLPAHLDMGPAERRAAA